MSSSPSDSSAQSPGDFSLDALEQRHLDRRQLQAAAVRAEDNLRHILAPPPPPARSWWARVRQRWAPSATPTAESPTDRYERTLRAVRALGFHLLALEQAAREATLDAEACAAASATLVLDARAEATDTVRNRLLVTLGRAEGLAPLVEAEADLLHAHHASLVELHHAANDVVRALGRQALATTAGRAHAHDNALVDAVVRKAIECAAELHHRADEHEARLAQLDAEARGRLAARAEVDGWLTARGTP